MYRWTDYDSGSSLVCPSNYLSIHNPPLLFLSPLHIQLSIYPPLFSLLCTSDYLSSIILFTTFLLFEVWHTNPYPHPFSLLCPSKCLSIHHFFHLFTVWTTTTHPVFSLLCPSSYLSLYPLFFSLIYRWTDHSPPFFLSPLPIQLLICLFIHTICWTNKKKKKTTISADKMQMTLPWRRNLGVTRRSGRPRSLLPYPGWRGQRRQRSFPRTRSK